MRVEHLGTGEPEVAVVGGIHGDEPCGVEAVEHVIEADPEVDRPVALIVANEEAIEAGRRYLGADLNRSFPGAADAPTHEGRLAHELGTHIEDCVTLALHSTQSYDGLFALVDEMASFSQSICPRLSVDAVVETGASEGRIFSSVPRTIEVECGLQGSTGAGENAIQVTQEFLAATGVLPGEHLAAARRLPLFRLGEPVPKRVAEEYEVFAQNFEEVPAGEAFAAVDGEKLVAEEEFHPVLMSAYGYQDVFGYTAERIGTVEP